MNCFHYTPGYLSLSRKNLSWHKNNFHSFPHISLLSTLALLKNWGIVFLPAAPRPAFSSNHTPQSVGRKLTTLRECYIRIVEVESSNLFRSTNKGIGFFPVPFFCILKRQRDSSSSPFTMEPFQGYLLLKGAFSGCLRCSQDCGEIPLIYGFAQKGA